NSHSSDGGPSDHHSGGTGDCCAGNFDPAYVGFAGGCACRACIDDQMKTGHRSSHVERVLRQLIMIMNRERGALSSSSSPCLTIRGKSWVALEGIRAVNGTPIKPSVIAIREWSWATTTVFGIALILLIKMSHSVTFLHRR